jgi:hypothetical protein
VILRGRTVCAIATALLVVDAATADSQERPDDLLTLARGALPVAIRADPALRVSMTQALLAIDGNAVGFTLTPRPGAGDVAIVVTIALPAPTTFSAFHVPDVRETPSPSQTFVRDLVVEGSAVAPDGPFDTLATVTLVAHRSRGERTTLPVAAPRRVRWVRVTMRGGLDVRNDRTFFEFSELEGTGTQEPVETDDGFTGAWRSRGVRLSLRQDGVTVAGCFDTDGRLTGTVSGRVLTATGATAAGIPSRFVLARDSADGVLGVRSTNGSPFREYAGARTGSPEATCPPPTAPPLGCGAVVHGINFDFDSAVIRETSAPVLDAVAAALAAESATAITITGHTSTEGEPAYNQSLSERRAAAVVEALVARGVERGRLEAVGAGESRPIADDAGEAGRALNRRVEIGCR